MDDVKKRLESIARICDDVARDHESHGCDTTPYLRAVRDAVREIIAGAYSRGPAQVASASYRENWETLFGAKPDRSVN